MGTQTTKPPRLPPVWFKHVFWRGHRLLFRFTGRARLVDPEEQARLGRDASHDDRPDVRQQRGVIVGYIEDGSTPVVLAMNGWDEGQPAWWLNLEAHPEAVVRLKGQPERLVRARRTEGEERYPLWRLWAAVDEGLDAYAASRLADTPVVVFESREAATDQTT